MPRQFLRVDFPKLCSNAVTSSPTHSSSHLLVVGCQGRVPEHKRLGAVRGPILCHHCRRARGDSILYSLYQRGAITSSHPSRSCTNTRTHKSPQSPTVQVCRGQQPRRVLPWVGNGGCRQGENRGRIVYPRAQSPQPPNDHGRVCAKDACGSLGVSIWV